MARYPESHKGRGSLCGSSLPVQIHAPVRGETSVRLPDAEVESPPPLLRLSVDQETWNRVQLIADVEADRTDRRLVSQPGTDGVTETAHTQPARIRPYVPAIHPQHAAPCPTKHLADMLTEPHHPAAADR